MPLTISSVFDCQVKIISEHNPPVNKSPASCFMLNSYQSVKFTSMYLELAWFNIIKCSPSSYLFSQKSPGTLSFCVVDIGCGLHWCQKVLVVCSWRMINHAHQIDDLKHREVINELKSGICWYEMCVVIGSWLVFQYTHWPSPPLRILCFLVPLLHLTLILHCWKKLRGYP